MSATEQDEIDAGQRVKQFLEDPAVAGALDQLGARYWEGFKSSNSAADREVFGAKARVLDDFKVALAAVVSNGAVATAGKAARERRTR